MLLSVLGSIIIRSTTLDYVRVVFWVFLDPFNEPIMLRPRRHTKCEAGTGVGQRAEGVCPCDLGSKTGAVRDQIKKQKKNGICSCSLSIGVPVAGLSSGDEHPETPLHLASEHHRLQRRLESLVLRPTSVLIRLAQREPWSTDPF